MMLMRMMLMIMSFAHRQSKADGLFFRHAGVLKARGPVLPRLRAWHGSPATSTMFGAPSWHVSAGLLRRARSWELQEL
eukprot:8056578-Pyramimonas_sp.AAC.1